MSGGDPQKCNCSSHLWKFLNHPSCLSVWLPYFKIPPYLFFHNSSFSPRLNTPYLVLFYKTAEYSHGCHTTKMAPNIAPVFYSSDRWAGGIDRAGHYRISDMSKYIGNIGTLATDWRTLKQWKKQRKTDKNKKDEKKRFWVYVGFM